MENYRGEECEQLNAKKILLTVFQYKKRTPPPVCIVMCIGLFFDIKFSFKISMMVLFVGSYYRHHFNKIKGLRDFPRHF